MVNGVLFDGMFFYCPLYRAIYTTIGSIVMIFLNLLPSISGYLRYYRISLGCSSYNLLPSISGYLHMTRTFLMKITFILLPSISGYLQQHLVLSSLIFYNYLTHLFLCQILFSDTKKKVGLSLSSQLSQSLYLSRFLNLTFFLLRRTDFFTVFKRFFAYFSESNRLRALKTAVFDRPTFICISM